MVTVDLFRLARHQHLLGHVRVLREGRDVFYAVVSLHRADDNSRSRRWQAPNRRRAINEVLAWANNEFGGDCVLKPLRHRSGFQSSLGLA